MKMKIILIDFSIITVTELKMICDQNKLNEMFPLLEYWKMEQPIEKAWVDCKGGNLVAMQIYGQKPYLTDTILDIEAVKPKLEVVLDLDLILDKINSYGLDSLVKEEVDYLNTMK